MITTNLKEDGISAVYYKIKDEKLDYNLEEEEERELLRKITVILISKSGKAGPEPKAKLLREDKKYIKSLTKLINLAKPHKGSELMISS